MTEPETRTLDVPDAELYYDVRSNEFSTQPVLLLAGCPMGASGFGTLAGHFADRTVVTYDPRGAERSKRTDGASWGTPDEHADDLRRLISTLGAGPVEIFGSSGGAVNALALVAKHPELVRTLVAHEPPAAQELPDREAVLAACATIQQMYQRVGFGPAMAKFVALVTSEGPVPDGFADQPAPDPAAFGLPAGDDGSRDHPLLGRHMTLCTGYQHDFGALRAAPVRIVAGVGEESIKLMPGRAAIAVAERLGTTPVTFPGGHGGFLSGAPGGKPEAFADTLRKVLSD